MENKLIGRDEEKRARMTVILLASLVVISIMFLIYAFIQKSEAQRQTKLVEKLKVELTQAKEEAMQQRKIAEEQLMRALEATELARREAELRKK